MANVMAVQDVQTSDRTKVIIYKVTLSGSYVQAVRGANTGEVLVLTSASNAKQIPGAYFGVNGAERGYPLQGGAGNSMEILPGADSQHWLLKLFSSTNTELAAAGYNAAVSGDLDIFIAFEGPSSH